MFVKFSTLVFNVFQRSTSNADPGPKSSNGLSAIHTCHRSISYIFIYLFSWFLTTFSIYNKLLYAFFHIIYTAFQACTIYSVYLLVRIDIYSIKVCSTKEKKEDFIWNRHFTNSGFQFQRYNEHKNIFQGQRNIMSQIYYLL